MGRPWLRRGAALAAALLLLAATGSAQERRPRAETGEILWERCKDGSAAPARWDSCRFFVGIAHEFIYIATPMLLGNPEDKVCVAAFDLDEHTALFVDYLRAHPEERHELALALYYRAIHEKYPCPGAAPAPG